YTLSLHDALPIYAGGRVEVLRQYHARLQAQGVQDHDGRIFVIDIRCQLNQHFNKTVGQFRVVESVAVAFEQFDGVVPVDLALKDQAELELNKVDCQFENAGLQRDVTAFQAFRH